jgi:TM2 domain-containing membrane protein YozV
MDLYKGKPVYNRIKVFVISLLFGEFGIDRIYLGDYTKGLIKFITFGGLGIWYFIDIFHIAVGKKISNQSYYWKCEVEDTCAQESHLIFKIALGFVAIGVLIMLYLYPRSIDSSKILRRENKPTEPPEQ